MQQLIVARPPHVGRGEYSPGSIVPGGASPNCQQNSLPLENSFTKIQTFQFFNPEDISNSKQRR